ncbi:MAG: efflux RND transporter periplasmic adaptor subunit [Planctomycetes bacterium]|nr:efflux RND transporter periplasmic adaptor subunit [Planctomycetota bacterium]
MSIQKRHAGRCPGRRRRGISILWVFVGAGGLMVMAIATLSVGWMLVGGGEEEEAGPLFHVVSRGVFIHDISSTGQVESANNVEFRCEVKSQGSGGTQIIEVVPEGTTVKPGDFLVKLDSSKIQTDLDKQRLTLNTARARVIQAQNIYDTAVITLKEYIEGIYKQDEQAILSLIFVAEEDLSRAEEYLRFSKRLAAKGYVTSQQLRADQFAVEKARNNLETAKTQLKVLQDYTQEKKTIQFKADIASAEAILAAEKKAYDLEQERLEEIQSQIDKCTIRSTHAGKVVHANKSSRRGAEVIIEPGTVVREHQVLIRLPDATNMQVRAKVNEAHIRLIHEGMDVGVEIDALPDVTFHGEISLVNQYPEPDSWYGSGVKEFAVFIKIDGIAAALKDGHDLKTGMTAQVSIHIDERPDVLQIPVQAVKEHGGEHYCVVRGESDWEFRKISVGPTNTKNVIVDGLEVGETVAMNPDRYLDKFDLPEISEDDRERIAKRFKRQPTDSVAARPGGPNRRGKQQGAGSASSATAGQMLKRMDKNGDGRLSADELPEGMRSRLPEMDTNGDQAIDASELAAAMAKMRKSRGGGKNGKPRLGAG